MVSRIAIYVEGGGSSSSTRDPFRRGMSLFLGSVVDRVRQKRMQWRVIPCGARSMAYRAFVDALEAPWHAGRGRLAGPVGGQAESRTRAEIEAALKRATRETQAGEYRKIRDGARLLGIVNALEVRQYCKWCDRLFRALDEAVEGRA